MGEEKSLFIEDLIEKKTIARGSYNKRSHAGGSGRKKWSCECLSKKELEKMNGETKTYRLKDPIKWAEFKEMPDDIKVMYIKGLRERFDCTDIALAQMFGIARSTLLHYFEERGIPHGVGDKYRRWDRAGFEAWYRTDAPEKAETVDVIEEAKNEIMANVENPDCAECEATERKKAVPITGYMSFEGRTEDILSAIALLLGGEDVELSVMWKVKDGAAV